MIKFLGKRWLEFEKGIYLTKVLARKKRKEIDFNRPKRFLCFQMNSIGDAIMTQPAWASLKSFLPEASIDLICRSHIAPLFNNDQAIHSIFPFESHKYRSWLFDSIRRLERIWFDQKYDFLIDFTALPLTAAACARESAPASIGFRRLIDTAFKRIDIGLAYDWTFPYSEKAALRNLVRELVSPWTKINVEKRFPTLSLSGDTIQKAYNLLNQKGLAQEKFIVLHPGAKWPPKKWPICHWRELIEQLGGELHLPVLVLGSKEDTEVIGEISTGLGTSCIQFLISDQIDVSSAIIKMAALCVCNDSAAMHIAAAVGTPSVSLFGPVSPNRSAPSIEEGCHVLYDDMFCSPCTLYYSRERCRRGINFCMYSMTPEMVYKKAKQIISEKTL